MLPHSTEPALAANLFQDNQLILLVTVYDEDKLEGKQTNDRLDYMQQLISYTPDFNGTHKTTLNFTLSGKVSRYVCLSQFERYLFDTKTMGMTKTYS